MYVLDMVILRSASKMSFIHKTKVKYGRDADERVEQPAIVASFGPKTGSTKEFTILEVPPNHASNETTT